MSTPGHTQGHYVFADAAAGLLFAGDHVLRTITPSIGFEPAYAEQPLGDFLASLAKVRALPDLALLPAHGSVRAGGRTAYDVAHELPWTWLARTIAELDLFNSVLATLETLAHLELLAARGDVTRTDAGGTLEFTESVA